MIYKIKTFIIRQLSAPITRKVLKIAAFIVLAVVCVQIIWPGDRGRPFLYVAGVPVGGATTEQIAEKLDGVKSNARFEIKMGEKSVSELFINAGITLNNTDTAKNTTYYPLWQRLVPFSILGNAIHHPILAVSYDSQNIKEHSKDWSTEAYIAAINSSITFDKSEPVLVEAKDGRAYQPEIIEKALYKLPVAVKPKTIVLKGDSVKPVRTDKDIKQLLDKTKDAVWTTLKLKVNNKEVTVPQETIASWIEFSESNDKKILSFAINKAELQKYLEPLQKEVYIAPGTTMIGSVDGLPGQRVEGSKGRGLNVDETVKAIISRLEKPSKETLDLVVTELEPTVKYANTYTKTSKGLTALLAAIGKSKGDFAITVQEVGGLNRYGSYNGTKKYHPASTYKLFVAYSILKRIDSGNMKWSSYYLNGYTVRQCFDAMIIQSDNACAEKFGVDIGWSTINSEIKAIGINNTNMLAGYKSSQTNDQVLFLNKLLYSNIVSDNSKNIMIDAMKKQVYRKGIPAGTQTTVADKVGFLDGLLHDTAVVYSAHGTYLVSIFSDGNSWSSIADAARQIEAYLAGT